MASPTGTNTDPPAQQAPTPGVGPGATGSRGLAQGAAPAGIAGGGSPYPPRQGGVRPSMIGPEQTFETAGAEPILYEDIDPGVLGRMFPKSFAVANSEAGQLALEAGERVREDGLHLRANVDEDQPQPESGTSAEPTDQPSSTRPQIAPARPGEAGLHDRATAAGVAFPPQQHAGDTPPHAPPHPEGQQQGDARQQRPSGPAQQPQQPPQQQPRQPAQPGQPQQRPQGQQQPRPHTPSGD